MIHTPAGSYNVAKNLLSTESSLQHKWCYLLQKVAEKEIYENQRFMFDFLKFTNQ